MLWWKGYKGGFGKHSVTGDTFRNEQAVLTNNFEVLPYVIAGTVTGSVSAWLAATTVQMLAARLFAKKPAEAPKAKAD